MSGFTERAFAPAGSDIPFSPGAGRVFPFGPH